MLYPKSRRPMTDELFLRPGREYRGAPFFAWNCKLNREDLLWQMEQLKAMGFGGAFLHVRTGLDTVYLSDEFFDRVEDCVEKAKKDDMFVWLYDEDRWPSGFAGGLVTRNPQYRQRSAVFTRQKREDGRLLAAYDVLLNEDGTLKSASRIPEDGKTDGFPLYVYLTVSPVSDWFNHQAYVNTLDPESIRAFLSSTHEKYEKRVGEEFGKTIPAIFTDEPQFSRKQTLENPFDEGDVSLPWTEDLPETFFKAYGQDLLYGLPELLWERADGTASVLRYRFHDHIAERFASAFADQIGSWCEKHALMLTGHMMDEPSLMSQTRALGEAMRSYRSFQLPGIDMLCDFREFTTAKQAQSAVRQFGREGMLSELYGVTNWDFDFRGHKLQGDWQAALGVTVRVPHLSWASMKGEAKRDYPASIHYQSPWYREYPYIEDHFARLNTVLTRGKPVCRVGVIHPVESYWLHWGNRKDTEPVRARMDRQFKELTEWLLRGNIDFDFLCESLLPSLCPEDFSGKKFPAGEMEYETVVVPPVETLRKTTVERLRRFVRQGGRVLFLGSAPRLTDALPSDEGLRLFEECEKCYFGREEILSALEGERDLEILDDYGNGTRDILYQLREEDGVRWLFLCHADKPEDPDSASGRTLTVRLKGRWKLTEYDTVSGRIFALSADAEGNCTVFRKLFYEHDSCLLRLEETDEGSFTRAIPSRKTTLRPAGVFSDEAECEPDEPNVLLLDRAQYALDGEEFGEPEEILRLDNLIRKRLSWPLRGGSIAQPWAEEKKPETRILRLRFSFDSEILLEGSRLALENAEISHVVLNGQEGEKTDKWYVDKCLSVLALPPVRPGTNLLEVSMPYGPSSNPEAMFLLGDFGVTIRDGRAILRERPEKIAFGDITSQGFPFYGGNLTYRMEKELTPGSYCLEFPAYRAALLRVFLDGKDLGPLVYSPYRVFFEIDKKGVHCLSVRAYGCRINTFGQVHMTDKKTLWWGPNSWRSEGEKWSDGYVLTPQGILKAPELYQCEAK